MNKAVGGIILGVFAWLTLLVAIGVSIGFVVWLVRMVGGF